MGLHAIAGPLVPVMCGGEQRNLNWMTRVKDLVIM